MNAYTEEGRAQMRAVARKVFARNRILDALLAAEKSGICSSSRKTQSTRSIPQQYVRVIDKDAPKGTTSTAVCYFQTDEHGRILARVAFVTYGGDNTPHRVADTTLSTGVRFRLEMIAARIKVGASQDFERRVSEFVASVVTATH